MLATDKKRGQKRQAEKQEEQGIAKYFLKVNDDGTPSPVPSPPPPPREASGEKNASGGSSPERGGATEAGKGPTPAWEWDDSDHERAVDHVSDSDQTVPSDAEAGEAPSPPDGCGSEEHGVTAIGAAGKRRGRRKGRAAESRGSALAQGFIDDEAEAGDDDSSDTDGQTPSSDEGDLRGFVTDGEPTDSETDSGDASDGEWEGPAGILNKEEVKSTLVTLGDMAPRERDLHTVIGKLPSEVDAGEWQQTENQNLEMRKKSRKDRQDVFVKATPNDGAIQGSMFSNSRFNYESHLVQEKTGDDLRPLYYVAPEPDQEYRLMTIGGPHLRLQAFQFVLTILSKENDPLYKEALHKVLELQYENIQLLCESKLKDVFDAKGVQTVIDAVCQGRKPQFKGLKPLGHVDLLKGKDTYEALFEDLRNVHKHIKKCIAWFAETNSLLIQLSQNGTAISFEDIKNENNRYHQLMVHSVIGPLVVWLLRAILEDVRTAKLGEVSCTGTSFTVVVPTSHCAEVKSVVAKAAEAFESRFFCARIDTRLSTVSANLSKKQRDPLGIITPLIRDCHLRIDGKESLYPIIRRTKKWVISDDEEDYASGAEADSDSDEMALGFSQSGGGTVFSTAASGHESDDDLSQEDDPCQLRLCSELPDDDREAFAVNFRKTINEIRQLTAEKRGWAHVLEQGEPWIDGNPTTIKNWKGTIKDMLLRIFECFTHVAVGYFVRGSGHKRLPPGMDKKKVIKLNSGDYYPRALALPHDFLDVQSKTSRQESSLKIQNSVNLNVWESPESRVDLATLFGSFEVILFAAKICYSNLTKVEKEFADPKERECAFVPDYMLNFNFMSDLLSEFSGSNVGDGHLQSMQVLPKMRHHRMLKELPIKRFTFGIGSKVLTLTDDDGITAKVIKLVDCDGLHSVHRTYDVDPKRAQEAIDEFESIYVRAQKAEETPIDFDQGDDFEDSGEQAGQMGNILKLFMKAAAKFCPHLLSMLLTQYCREDLSESDSWFPTEDMIDKLTMDQMKCAMATMKSFCVPWSNWSSGQRIVSINGRAGAGKTSLIKLYQAIFDDPKSDRTFKSVLTLPQENGPNIFKPFLNQRLCYKGIFPYVFYIAADRMKHYGTKIPEEIKDTILGETGNTTVRAADKYVKQEDRKIIPFGVVDSGNSFPDELVESIEKGDITAHQAAVRATSGGKDGDVGASERRVEIVTPFNRICDPTVSRCAIQNRYISADEMAKLQENDDVVLFTLIASFFASKICASLKISAQNTALYEREIKALALHETVQVKKELEAYFHLQVDSEKNSASIKVFDPDCHQHFNVKLSNSMTLEGLCKLLKEKNPGSNTLTSRDIKQHLADKNPKDRFACKHCGLTLSGATRAKLYKLQILKELDENRILKNVFDGKCDMADEHDWKKWTVIEDYTFEDVQTAKTYMEKVKDNDEL